MLFLVDKIPISCNECECCNIQKLRIPNTKIFKSTYNCRLTGESNSINHDITERFDRCPLKEYSKPPPITINSELLNNLTKTFDFKGGENY